MIKFQWGSEIGKTLYNYIIGTYKNKAMAKKNNVIAEIQELIQQIKNEYREGVDYKFSTWDEIHEAGVGIVRILSPHLRQYCRERFNFPSGVNDFLDYYKEDINEGACFY